MFILLDATPIQVLFLYSIAILNVLAEAAIMRCSHKVATKVIHKLINKIVNFINVNEFILCSVAKVSCTPRSETIFDN